MKGKSSKLKLQRRIADFCTMTDKSKEKYVGYKMPGSIKRT